MSGPLQVIAWAVADFIRPATAAGLIERQGDFPFHHRPLALTEAGRAALLGGLRVRPVAPRIWRS